jgi:hypothetical protein
MTVANKVICPICSYPVNIIKFGNGWLGTCCNKICYNSPMPPSVKLTESNNNLNFRNNEVD